ncbi:hypothetical protein SAY87_014768 [Trapa incisa]|uniref:Non-specific lipid-transfer protein n=2 Tax=Trapa TaxID=22665 RepID=A0AAN7MZL4_TRANT|nr:hypothetical protein SAY87_014768 [Trapa incisa]KAK4802611.1 hypothetical protein SAY86_000814 [Trapa natans]
MASTSSLLKLASCLVVVYMAMAFLKADTAITCGQVAGKTAPCIPYVRGKGVEPVPLACCNGIKALAASARTTQDRRATCNCLKSSIPRIPGINLKVLASLPSRCGVNIPYQINPSTNCNSVN